MRYDDIHGRCISSNFLQHMVIGIFPSRLLQKLFQHTIIFNALWEV